MRKGIARPYDDNPEVFRTFQPGDRILAVDDHTLGVVEFCRAADHRCCIRWETGTREWVDASAIGSSRKISPIGRLWGRVFMSR